MQVIVLASGKGSRLGKLGETTPKLLLDLGNYKLIDRLFLACKKANIEDVILVIGHQADKIRKYVIKNFKDFNITFVDESKLYLPKHNNIYSLYLTIPQLYDDDTILIESDLIYRYDLLKNLTSLKDNIIVLSKKLDYMDGSCVSLDGNKFIEGQELKTVNIYKFNKDFLKNTYARILKKEIESKHNYNVFYEEPLLPILNDYNFKPYILNGDDWFEVDTLEDYKKAISEYSDSN